MERLVKYYTCPMTWEVFGTIESGADALEEAVQIAEDSSFEWLPDIGRSDIIEDSMRVDTEAVESYND